MNHKDFHNLLDIYLDAAFFPRPLERNFRQEGHRLDVGGRSTKAQMS
jgi:Zn-dependent M16 (insulinase) family peptidase